MAKATKKKGRKAGKVVAAKKAAKKAGRKTAAKKSGKKSVRKSAPVKAAKKVVRKSARKAVKKAAPKKRAAGVQTMNFPEYIPELRKIYASYGASLRLAMGNVEEILVEAEAKLGFSLEPGLREAWRMANGSERWMPVFAKPGFLTGYDFLSLDAAIKERAGMERRAPSI